MSDSAERGHAGYPITEGLPKLVLRSLSVANLYLRQRRLRELQPMKKPKAKELTGCDAVCAERPAFERRGNARLAKKLVPRRQELIARPFEDKAGPGGLLPGEIPGILNINAYIRHLSSDSGSLLASEVDERLPS